MDFKIDDQSCFFFLRKSVFKKRKVFEGKKTKKNLGGTKTLRFAIDAFTAFISSSKLEKEWRAWERS